MFKLLWPTLLLMTVASAALAVPCTFSAGSNCGVAAPEIDPASALSGLTLLIGGIAVIRGRRRK
jgi:hypothetical protein